MSIARPRAVLSFTGGEGALDQSALDDDACALGQRLGHVLRGVAPDRAAHEQGLPVLPLAGLAVEGARRGGDREGGHRCPGGREAHLGVRGEVPDDGDDGVSGHGVVSVPGRGSGLGTQQLGAQNGLVEAELAVELLGDLGRGGHVHDGVEALGLLLDVVGQPALAPDVDLVHGAPVAGDDLQQLLERRVGGALVRLGVEDDHDLVVTHAWYPPPLVCGGHGPSVTGG